MLETIKTILFSTAVLLLIFFYGHYVLFKLLELFNLKTEKQDIIAFVIFAVFISFYPAFLSKLTSKLLVKLGIFGWLIAAILYVICYHRFKKQVEHRDVSKKKISEKA